MKRTTLFMAILLAFLTSTTNAQDPTFVKGDKIINLGIGFGNVLYSGLGYHTTIPPLSLSAEYGVVDGIANKGSIGVGGYLGYSSYKYESSIFNTSWGWKYSTFILAARGTFHYPLIDRFDTYAGLMIGAKIVTSTEFGSPGFGYTNTTASGSGGLFSFFLGGRYFLTDNFALMAELGYGISYLTVGVAFKF